MARMVNFAYQDPLPSWFVNALQEEVSTPTGNVLIRLANSTTIEVPAADGNAQAGISINGVWRYNKVLKQRAHPGGAAGVYDIYFTASNNDIRSTPQPGSDFTNYEFGISIVASGATPPIVAGVVDRFRLVGRLSWDGAAITDLRPEVDSARATDPLRPTSTLDSSVPLKAYGRSATHTADLLQLYKNVGSAAALSVGAGGAITALGGATLGGALAVTGGGTFSGGVNAASYAVAGTALAASHLSNGVTGSGAVALAASPVLSGTPTAPTATAGTNTAQLATTAFVAAAIAGVTGNATLGGTQTFTGVNTFSQSPIIPTVAQDTNSTAAASTAFVVGQAAAVNPLVNGAVAVGSSLRYARQDHVHPIDTSRAPVASPTFTGTVTLPSLVSTSTTLGFFGATPVTRPSARTLSNWTSAANALRSIDRNNFTIAQLYDVVATMIDDLRLEGLYA